MVTVGSDHVIDEGEGDPAGQPLTPTEVLAKIERHLKQ